MSFQYPLTLSTQLILPAVLTGLCFGSFLLSLYIYRKMQDRVYLSVAFILFLAFLFTVGETFNIFFTAVTIRPYAALSMHRLQQLAALFLTAAVPYYMYYVFAPLSKKFTRINRILYLLGIVFSVLVFFTALIFPDTFISVTTFSPRGVLHEISRFRGHEGFLYHFRDIYLGILFIYFLVFLVKSIRNKSISDIYMRIVFAGFLFAFLFSLVSMLDVYFEFLGKYLPPVLNLSYVSLGMAVLALATISGTFLNFTDSLLLLDRTTSELEESRRRFYQFANLIPTTVIEMDRHFRIDFINFAGERKLGYTCSELQDPRNVMALIGSPEKKLIRSQVLRVLKGVNVGSFEARLIAKNGKVLHTYIKPVSVLSKGRVEGLRASITDITKVKESETRLVWQTFHDVLTGLKNRKAFEKQITEFLQFRKGKQSPEPFALLYLDLLRFKMINESAGHETGDEVLKVVAQRLKKLLRDTDFIYRISGDEFAVVLSVIEDEADITRFCQKILQALKEPLVIHEHRIYTGVSIGIVVFPKDGESVNELMKNADKANYIAKKNENHYQFYTEDLNRRAMRHIELENELRLAIDQDEFEMYYQPQIAFGGKIIGLEALVRWNHPQKGMIPPGTFIPFAEETGLIVDISEIVIRQVCHYLESFQKNDKIDISINLSPRYLYSDEAFRRLLALLDTMAPHLLKHVKFELTENSVMDHPEASIERMRQIRAYGITFAIDDFGTGYSSLAYISKFDIDTLKIDREFIKHYPSPEYKANETIIKAIINLALSLGMKTIAEGAETKEQVDFLYTHGCHTIQGFYYYKPMPFSQCMRLLKS